MPYTFNDILAAVQNVTNNPRERATLLYACGAETGCQSINQIGGGPGRGPWQIETGAGGSSYGRFTDAQANNPTTAAQLFYRFWNVAGCTAQQGSLWVSDPHTAEYNAARCAEGGGGTAASNIGAPYSAAQRATGAHYADIAMSSTTPNLPPNFDPNDPLKGLFPGGVLQTGVGPDLSGITGALTGIAKILARIVDAMSSLDFWVSVLLVIGGGWLTITGAGNIVARGAMRGGGGAATMAAAA